MRKIFSRIWVPKSANFAKDIFKFVWIVKFRIYMNRDIIFREVNFIPRSEDYSFSVEIQSLGVNLDIFLRMDCLTLISQTLFLRNCPIWNKFFYVPNREATNRKNKVGEKLTKFFTSDDIFSWLIFNPILFNPDFFFSQ